MGVQAATLMGFGPRVDAADLCIFDVTPLTLGVETAGGLRTPVIWRNTTMPTQWHLKLKPFAPNQPSALIRIVTGERALAKDNFLIRELQFPLPPSAVQGSVEICFFFDLDGD